MEIQLFFWGQKHDTRLTKNEWWLVRGVSNSILLYSPLKFRSGKQFLCFPHNMTRKLKCFLSPWAPPFAFIYSFTFLIAVTHLSIGLSNHPPGPLKFGLQSGPIKKKVIYSCHHTRIYIYIYFCHSLKRGNIILDCLKIVSYVIYT